MKIDILAFGAHPDDVELGCGGTLAKEISMQKKVGVIDLTQGELGTRGTAKTRAQEASKAASILQIAFRENLKMPDGFFKNNKKNQLRIIEQLRRYQPEVVFCNAIQDRHIDHGKGSQLVRDACFLSGLEKIKTQHAGQFQDPWRPKCVYSYQQWNMEIPDFVVDISQFIDQKLQAIMAYQSQFYFADSQERETPISSQNFLDSITYRARDLGRLVGVAHGEGFTTERIPLVDSIFDLK